MMGNSSRADISLLEKVSVGDYIMVHAGFAIQKYDEEEALATFPLLEKCLERPARFMNLVNFTDKTIAEKLLREIHVCADHLGTVKFMEVCGTHTMEIGRLGLRSLLPKTSSLYRAPDARFALQPGRISMPPLSYALGRQVHIITYGDMVRLAWQRIFT